MRALWSDRQNCSHNVSQKVKRIRRFSDRPDPYTDYPADRLHYTPNSKITRCRYKCKCAFRVIDSENINQALTKG